MEISIHKDEIIEWKYQIGCYLEVLYQTSEEIYRIARTVMA
jgi:hypothetical protein